MSSQQRLNGSTHTVANELLLLRKLASLRRSASWQLTVERSRKPVAPDLERRTRDVDLPKAGGPQPAIVSPAVHRTSSRAFFPDQRLSDDIPLRFAKDDSENNHETCRRR